MALQIRRGTDLQRQSVVLAAGEPFFVTNYAEIGGSPLWIGDGTTQGGVVAEGVSNLDELLDVTLTNPQNNDFLRYNSTNGRWENVASLNTGNLTLTGDIAINGGDATTTASTFNLINTTATTLNVGGAATSVNIGNTTGTTTINNAALKLTGNTIKASDSATAITLSNSNVTVEGDLTVKGNDILSSTGTAITLAGADVTIAGDLTVTGNDIKSNTGTAITLSGTNATVNGNLILGSNIIKASDGTTALTTSATTGSVTVAGDLKIGGDDILASTGATAITLSGANVSTAGNLTTAGDVIINGNNIKSNGGTTAISLLGNSATVAGQLTVSGNLVVNGTTTTVNSTNLNVTDNMILLNKDETGAGVTAGVAGIEIERGTSPNVQLQWNETDDRWEITTNGSSYTRLPNQNLDTTSSPTFADLTLTGDLAVNGGDITTTAPIGNLYNTGPATVNIGNAATTEVNLGNNGSGARVQVKSPTIVGASTTQAVFNTVATTVNAFGAATTLNMGANTGTATINNAALKLTGNTIKSSTGDTAITLSGSQVILPGIINVGEDGQITFTKPASTSTLSNTLIQSTITALHQDQYPAADYYADDTFTIKHERKDPYNNTPAYSSRIVFELDEPGASYLNSGRPAVVLRQKTVGVGESPTTYTNSTDREVYLMDHAGETHLLAATIHKYLQVGYYPNSGLTGMNTVELLTPTITLGYNTPGYTPTNLVIATSTVTLNQKTKFDGTTLVIDPDTNRVGIKTDSPAADLHVNGTIFGNDVVGLNNLGGNTKTLILNYDNGTDTTDGFLKIQRGGTGADVSLKWNETTDRWQFTNDGSTYYNMLTAGDLSYDLNSLTDVVIDTPVTNQLLKYNGTNWVNSTVSYALDDLSDVVITSSTTGQLMTYNGTNWVNNNTITATSAAQTVNLTRSGAFTADTAGITRNALRLTKKFTDVSGTVNDKGGPTLTFNVEGSDNTVSTYAAVTSNRSATGAHSVSVLTSSDNFATNTEVASFTPTDASFPGTVSTSGVIIDSRVIKNTATQTYTTTSQQVFGNVPIATFRSIKYTWQISRGSEFQILETMVIHDGTNAYITTYGDTRTGANLANFDVDISGSNMRILVTPTSTASTVLIADYTLFYI